MIPHPTGIALSRYSDARPDAARSTRVSRHLASCPRCRAELAEIRALGDAARRAPAPPIDGDAWDRIAAERRGGARVLLPIHDPPRAASRPRWVVAAAAAVAIAAAGLFAIPLGRGLSASPTGKLVIRPALPPPGALLTLHYRPVAALADEPRLVIRARYLSATNVGWVTWLLWDYYAFAPSGEVVGTLTRNVEGSFGGSVRLPDSAVYALFALEDVVGEHVDADAGRLWDLVAAGPDGRPSFAGLVAQASRSVPANQARALGAADSLVTLYPDSAQSWRLQVARQGSSRIPHWLRVFDRRERRFAALDRELGHRAAVSPAEASAMVFLAASIEDSAAAERWRSRLIADHPTDPLAVVAMAERAVHSSPAGARAELPAAEAAWPVARGAAPVVAEEGLNIALRSGDSTAIYRWTVRSYSVAPAGFIFISPGELRDSTARAAAASALRAELRRLASDSSPGRSLLTTRSRDRLRRKARTAHTLGSLAQVLIADDRPAAARDTLDVALSLAHGLCGFDDLYGLRANADAALGDSAGAVSDSMASKRRGACSRDWWKP